MVIQECLRNPVATSIWITLPSSIMATASKLIVTATQGLMIAILVAGTDDIPDSYFEAADIDGASKFRQFISITLPMLKPQIFFLIVIFSINTLKVFEPIYMLTGPPKGGPANSTQVLTLHMFNQIFTGQRFSYGSAIAIIIFLLLIIFVFMQIKFYQKVTEK